MRAPRRRYSGLLPILSCAALAALLGSAFIVGCAGNTPSSPGNDGGGDDDDDDDGADANPNDPDGAPPTECENGGLGEWTGHDNVPPSKSPPCGIAASAAPMFVSLGFDDNGDAAGMTWALDMLKERNKKATFFMTSVYGASATVTATWKRARQEGHEIGNHTVSHLPNHGGKDFTTAQWEAEIGPCTDFLTGSADVAEVGDVTGFRTPYLEYGDPLLTTVQSLGFKYDASIEEGYEYGHDGSTEYWPYTLDNRSPGHTTQVEWMDPENPVKEINPHPGLWEMPVYAVFVPPDDKCAEYGVPTGFRNKMKSVQSWYDTESGAITGFDYNLWASANVGGFGMTKAEVLATLKYTYDQHAKGNHAPFLFGTHTAYYVDAWSANASGTPAAKDRQAAIEEFIDYVTEKGGRVETHQAILDWIRNPGK